MTGPDHDRRLRDVLLVTLTASAGAVDAISWIVLGKVFSAFMTGNVVFLAFRTAGVPEPSVVRVLAALGAFGIGALVAARIVAPPVASGGAWPRRVTVALGVSVAAQAIFLVMWIAVDGRPSTGSGDLLIAISGLAMGMQTSAILSLGVRGVFTTAATATWAVLMGDVSAWSSSRGERRRLAGAIAGLFAGAAAGALLVIHARAWAPVLPLGLGGLVVAVAALGPGVQGVAVRSTTPGAAAGSKS
jgi:uncharacterized membrane protein YoaK (UPF0700 family)